MRAVMRERETTGTGHAAELAKDYISRESTSEESMKKWKKENKKMNNKMNKKTNSYRP